MKNGISDKLSKILEFSCHEAMRTGSYEVLPEHLLLGIIRHKDNSAAKMMEESGIDLQALKKDIEESVSKGTYIPYGQMDRITISTQILDCLEAASGRAETEGRAETDTTDLITALCNGWDRFPATSKMKSDILSRAKESPEKTAKQRISSENYDAIFSEIIRNSRIKS